MPIKKVKGGYKWGESGKVYPTKAQAAKQARAAYASGYKGYQTGGGVTQSTDPFAPNFEMPRGGGTTTVGGPRESVSFGPSILNTMLFGGEGLTGPWQGRGAFGATPETRLARGFFDPNLGPSGVARILAQREIIKRMAQEYGPIVSLIGNKGGLLGLGTSGIGGLGLEQAYRDYGIGAAAKIANRIKLLQMAPGIAGLGAVLGMLQEVDPKQRGILGGTLGPQLRNLFARILPIKSFAEKEAEDVDMYPDIQPVEVTAQMRETDSMREERERAERAERAARVQQFAEQSLMNRIAETGGDPSAYMYGLVPGVAQSTNQGLRALNFLRRMAKRKTPSKRDWYRPERKISAGGASRK